ncbi:S1 family peptidase [Cellulomonas aerilata]|uniref:Peptidase S1 domain-containing protein n=1 Tax=Cellulomonas aerilata TaxID=515326 RepID=A0A512DBK5_9CELL|nr:trypsin-like serine protease [Cellulomonas aerilata]GEO33868.1 hypothetical protein CAE01nite_15930 [Cellulomonas aerilata]
MRAAREVGRRGRRLWTASSLAAVTLAVAASPAGAITFGELDGELHPNVGALLVEDDAGGYASICTGTLIDEDVFLTAAHCLAAVEEFDLGDVFVSFDTDLTDGVTGVLDGDGVMHPLYGSGGANNAYDIAVVLLDQPVAGIEPAALPEVGLLDRLQSERTLRRQPFTAVGYGLVREDKTGGPAALVDDPRRRFTTQTAASLQKAWLLLSMQPSTGDGGTCFGDSGGPHFLGGADSNLVVAITVTGDAVCRATDKTYRLDTPWSSEFLAQFLD